MSLPFFTAIGGGLLNAFSNAAERKTINRRIDSLIGDLEDAMYDTGEISARRRDINASFNNAITTTLNKSAFNARGVINAPVAKAAAAAPIEASRQGAILDWEQRADNYNLGVLDRISQLEASRPSGNPVGDFVGGAVQGGIAGAQIDYLMSDPNAAYDNWKPNTETPELSVMDMVSSSPFQLSKVNVNDDSRNFDWMNDPLGEDIILPDIKIGSKIKSNFYNIEKPKSKYTSPQEYIFGLHGSGIF